MAKTHKYSLSSNGDFIIDNYHLAKPFSSFFPGIAGVWGVPIWAFYVNRGQGIASFGIKDKDHPLMEFQPANKAYYLTPILGFRTFIKMACPKGKLFYDAFHNGMSAVGFDINNRMIINSYELKLNEINRTLGLSVDIEYFTIPNDNYGALVRKLMIKNISHAKKRLQVLDGMPQIIPYGLTNMFLKKLSRTVEAWMGVENLKKDIPFFKLKVDPTDRAEVTHIERGNFYLSFDGKGLIRPIVDPEAIFGQQADFTYPSMFLKHRSYKYPAQQLRKGRTPCCMPFRAFDLKPDQAETIYTVTGNMDNVDKLNANAGRIAKEEYILAKQQENKVLINDLQSMVSTHSGSNRFDFYCRQNFLDNIIRGGYPLSVEHPSGHARIQVYTRKHGDLERDYNKYLIEPTFFSQGNGNYRDVNQNRRCDIWFNKQVREDGIIDFFNFIQTDGYNPLIIKPDCFRFNQDMESLSGFFDKEGLKKLRAYFKYEFTPGDFFSFIEKNRIGLIGRKRDLLGTVLSNSTKSIQAEHGEGFWTDHWHYSLDLLESHLGLYPEDLRSLLIDRKDFTFFDNSYVVRPRDMRYILTDKGVYQYNCVAEDHHKATVIKKRYEFPYLSRTKNGEGQIYTTTLLVKMLTIIANKISSLDPSGVGIEMEAGKPNWYDSLNGLPALLGSSTCETFELKRWILFIKDSIRRLRLDEDHRIALPQELKDLLKGLDMICRQKISAHRFWDRSQTLKEKYRQKTIMGFSGPEGVLKVRDIMHMLAGFLHKVDSGLKKAYDKDTGLYYSYFINEVIEYKAIGRSEHMRHAKALGFRQRPLPLFLEGMVHCLRVTDPGQDALRLYNAVRKSPLFDRGLKMYKVNASLNDMPEEIGRSRVFMPGWLENESIWLHMEYKFMLELLKKGLYTEFYDNFKNVLIPFQSPERYGRSMLENSSFLVSSAFPQKKLHGNGFVARLSGSTAEFINIWLIICAGVKPFYLDKSNSLCFELKPILPGWLFTKRSEKGLPKDSFSFRFLNSALIVYNNPRRADLFSKKAKLTKIELVGGREVNIKGSVIPSPYSNEVRDGNVGRIDLFF